MLGADDRAAAITVGALYDGVRPQVIVTDPASAETIKYAANAFLATKLSFINAIARSGSTLHKNVAPLMKLFDAYQCYFAKIDSPIRTMADVPDRLRADATSVTFAFPVGLGSPL